MHEMVFAFTAWLLCLVSIGINIKINDRLGRILTMVTFFIIIIVVLGILLIKKEVIP